MTMWSARTILAEEKRLLKRVFISGVILVAMNSAGFAQSPAEVRRSFSLELASHILDSSTLFRSEGPARGWRGIALASPATSTAALVEAQGGLPRGIADGIAHLFVFDNVVEMRNGLANLSMRELGSVWRDLLVRSMPRGVTNFDTGGGGAPWSKWLYRQPDHVDVARGINIYREPSDFIIKYSEYSLAYENLLAGKPSDSWRIDPKLSRYRTFEQAEKALLDEWLRYGYKSEVEQALKVSMSTPQWLAWSRWTAAEAPFKAASLRWSASYSVPQSYLFPPPDSWGLIGSWRRMRSVVAGVPAPISYQLLTVRVLRPWMHLGALLDGNLIVDPKLPSNEGYVLSSGVEPTFEATPEGAAATFIEELLLVRGIHPVDSSAAVPPSAHPLSSFAYPDAIHLIGYVVRVLPKFPR